MLTFLRDKNFRVLLSGSTLSQAIPIVLSPVITRLYAPEEFGSFSIILSIAMVLSVVITGRFELAIGLTKQESHAYIVCRISILISLLLSILMILSGWFFIPIVQEVFGLNLTVTNFHYSVSIALLIAVFQSAYYLALRGENFSSIALSKISQTIAVGLGQILFSIVTPGKGLIFAQIIGQAVSIFCIAKNNLKYFFFSKLSVKKAKVLIKRYKKFPLVLSFSHTLGVLSPFIPIMYIGFYYDSHTAGLVALVQRVIGLPLVVVSSVFGDIFKQKASEHYRENNSCIEVYDETLKRLVITGVLPFVCLYIISPYMFSTIFGSEWEEAGLIAQPFALMFLLRYVSSPLSFMYLIAEKQSKDLYLQLVIVTVSIASFVLTESAYQGIIAYTTSYSLIYCFNVFITRNFAKGNK